jgi:replicative DNA helicase
MTAASEMAERAILGIVIDHPSEAGQVFARIKPGEFTGPQMLIAEAIHGLRVGKKPIDTRLVVAELERRSTLNRIGGPAFVASLMNEYSSKTLLMGYVTEVVRAVQRRRAWEIAQRTRALMEEDDVDPLEAVRVLRDQLQEILDGSDDGDMVMPKTLVPSGGGEAIRLGGLGAPGAW